MGTYSPQPLYKFTKLQECKWVLCPLCSKQSSEFNQLILLAKYCSSQDARHVVLNYEVPFTTSAWYVFFFFFLNESSPCESLETCKRDLIFIPHSPLFLCDSKGGKNLVDDRHQRRCIIPNWISYTPAVCCVFFFQPTPHPSIFSSMHHHSAPLSPTNIFFFISFALAPRLLLPLKCLLWEIVCKGLSFLSTSSSEVLLFPDIYCTV